MPQEPAWLTSAARMAERRQPRESGAQDGRSERPAMGRGQPRPANSTRSQCEPLPVGGGFDSASRPAKIAMSVWKGRLDTVSSPENG